MKQLIFSLFAAASVFSFSACEGDGDHRQDHGRVTRTTTTTEESTIQHPLGATAETRTIRAY